MLGFVLQQVYSRTVTDLWCPMIPQAPSALSLSGGSSWLTVSPADRPTSPVSPPMSLWLQASHWGSAILYFCFTLNRWCTALLTTAPPSKQHLPSGQPSEQPAALPAHRNISETEPTDVSTGQCPFLKQGRLPRILCWLWIIRTDKYIFKVIYNQILFFCFLSFVCFFLHSLLDILVY